MTFRASGGNEKHKNSFTWTISHLLVVMGLELKFKAAGTCNGSCVHAFYAKSDVNAAFTNTRNLVCLLPQGDANLLKRNPVTFLAARSASWAARAPASRL